VDCELCGRKKFSSHYRCKVCGRWACGNCVVPEDKGHACRKCAWEEPGK